MTTYGWGTGEPVSFDNSGNNRTDALRMGLVMTGDLDFCKERIDGFVDHNESGICVMFNAKLPNAICSGDAGTGLYFSDENKKQVLVAISSFVVGEKGKLCGKSDSVTYFTKVDDYTEFIFKKR
ncbi:hypothetical protein LPJ75_005450 [Coemansia sp. RSA 2598]|nr:hypothetical protein LPJ75_005450 [Coemansia sp. RSA 2598]